MKRNSSFSSFLTTAVSLVALTSLVACDPAPKESIPTEVQQTAASVAETVQWPAITSAVKKDPAMEARVEELLAKMTLEEKIGQVVQPEIKQVTAEDIKKYHIGSVLNGGGSTPGNNKYASLKDWVDLADSYYNASIDKSDGRLGIPVIWGTDAVHGLGNVVGATLFPHNIGLGAANNPELLKQIGWATAREIAATGLDWDFSPTVAVARNDRWGRTYESWSEDPAIVRAYAGKMVEGLQGVGGSEDFLTNHQVIATAKHFIGDGGTHDGIDQGWNKVSEKELRDIHGAGYFSALESGVQVIMASFSGWDDIRMHGQKYLLTDVLKNQMGFDGLIVGDWNGHALIPGCTPVDCPESLMAGLDIYMAPEPNWKDLYNNLLEQTKAGEITQERLDDAVRRILRVKIRAGLFEKGAPSTRPLAGKQEILGAPEHRAIARQAVRESLVMLKNKNNLLPLARKQNVLVAGDGADNIGKQAGGWSVSWQGTGNTNADFPGGTSIYAGINEVVSAAGGKAVLSVDGSYKEKPDVAIVVFGEEPYAESQGDVPNLAYKPRDPSDWELLKKLRSAGIPVVSLFISGRPMWVNRELNASDAFVAVWLPGSEGNGVADVIFKNAEGAVNFDMKGRLSFSWPKHPMQTPLNRDDASYDPLFAYGYGLSYADKDTLADDLSEEGVQIGDLDKLELFNRRPIDPWQIELLGSKAERVVMNTNTVKATSIVVKSVDRNQQEDARRIQWDGTGNAQVALVTTADVQNFAGYLSSDAALVVDVKVDAAPSAATLLRVSCGTDCVSDLDVTEQLKAAAGQGWKTITIGLACFKDAGKKPAKEIWNTVVQPFALSTAGTLDVSISEVSVVKGAAKAEGVSCP